MSAHCPRHAPRHRRNWPSLRSRSVTSGAVWFAWYFLKQITRSRFVLLLAPGRMAAQEYNLKWLESQCWFQIPRAGPQSGVVKTSDWSQTTIPVLCRQTRTTIVRCRVEVKLKMTRMSESKRGNFYIYHKNFGAWNGVRCDRLTLGVGWKEQVSDIVGPSGWHRL